MEREAKRIKSPETRSRKRPGDSDLRDEFQAERERARETPRESGPQPSSSVRPSRTDEFLMLLKKRVFPHAESVEEPEVSEIGQLLLSFGMTKTDIAEIYNPERFVWFTTRIRN